MQILDYLRKRGKRLAPATHRMHGSVLRAFEAWVGCYDREPTVEDVEEFIVDSPVKNTSLKTYLSVIKQYFRVMRLPDRDDLSDVYDEMAPAISQDDFRRNVLTKREIEKVVDKLDGLVDLACVLGYVYCRRMGEVLGLTGGDIHTKNITFNISKKAGTDRVDLPLDMMSDFWREKLLERNGKDRVIPYTSQAIRYKFRKALKAAGIKKDARFHDLRHSRICHLLDDGVSARYIQAQLSYHARLATIYDIYGRVPSEATFEIPAVEWL